MRIQWRTEWPFWLLLEAQFLLAAVTWPMAPEQIPTHWGLDGRVDGYGNRLQGLLLLPLVALGLYLALLIAPQIGDRRDAFPPFAGSYTVLRFAVLAVMTAMYGMIHLAIRGYEVEMNRVVPLSIGALFMVIGNQMGQLRPADPAAPSTAAPAPSSHSSRAAWTRTNRHAGRLMGGAGMVMIVAGLFSSSWLMVGAVAGTVTGAVWLTVSSYGARQKDADQDGAGL